MKLVFGLVLMLAWATSSAQQPPRVMEKDQVPREAQVPKGWRERPDKQVPTLPVPPPPQVPQVPPGASTAQAELLQAQTAAIKALAAKVDELSARVSKLEKGAR